MFPYYPIFILNVFLCGIATDDFDILAIANFEEKYNEYKLKNGSVLGGAARIKTLMTEHKGCKLFLGNILSKYRSTAIERRVHKATKILQHLEPTFLMLGKNEFRLGKPILEQFYRTFSKKIPLSNVKVFEQSEISNFHNCPPLIGYFDGNLNDSLTVTEIRVEELISSLERLAFNYKRTKQNVVMAIGCADNVVVERIAKHTKSIAMVINGCGHLTKQLPRLVLNVDGNQVPVINFSGSTVQAMKISLRTKHVSRVSSNDYNASVIIIDGRIEPNKQLDALLNVSEPGDLITPISVKGIDDARARPPQIISRTRVEKTKEPHQDNNVLGKSMVFLNGQCLRSECNYGNLVADAFVQYKSNTYEGEHWTNTTIALVAGGMINSSINATFRNGVIYRQDVDYSLVDDQLVTIELAGMDIRRSLNHGFDVIHKLGAGKFLQVSGLRIVYDPFNDALQKLVSVKVRTKFKVPRYILLIRPQIYNVIMTRSLANGAFGHTYFKDHGKIISEEKITAKQAVCDYIKRLRFVYVSNSDRIAIQTKLTSGNVKGCIQNGNLVLALVIICVFYSLSSAW